MIACKGLIIFTCTLATLVNEESFGNIRYPVYLVLNLSLMLKDFELILKNWSYWMFMKGKARILKFFVILLKLIIFHQPAS